MEKLTGRSVKFITTINLDAEIIDPRIVSSHRGKAEPNEILTSGADEKIR